MLYGYFLRITRIIQSNMFEMIIAMATFIFYVISDRIVFEK